MGGVPRLAVGASPIRRLGRRLQDPPLAPVPGMEALLHTFEKKPKAIIFDFDQTLADSTEAVVACIDYALVGLGFPQAPAETVRRAIGLSLEATLEALTGSRDPRHQVSFRELFVEHADRVMVARTEFLDGVPSALSDLRALGFRLAIVSTKYRYRIEAILDRHGARHLFEVIVGGEDTARHKPDPEGLDLAMRRLGIRPPQGLYVGDHLVDAEAAAAAGIPFIPVMTGATEYRDFMGYPRLEILEGVATLPAYLSEVDGWPPSPADGFLEGEG